MTIIELLKSKAPNKYKHEWGEREGEVSIGKISRDCGIARATLYNASANNKISSKTIDILLEKFIDNNNKPLLAKADFLPYI